MKKILIVLFATAISSFVITKSKAQSFGTNSAASTVTDNSSSASKAEMKKAAKLSKAFFKASEDFSKEFKSERNVSWYTSSKVISAAFTKGDVYTTVVYDRKGRWIRTTNRYKADKLPMDIRFLVNWSEYSKYEITLVQEIHENQILFYVIYLEDDKSYKEITVYDGEVNLLSNIKKQ